MESSHSVSHSASRESSRTEEEQIFEISYTSHKDFKTAAKAALFVGSLFLAGGAVVSYFTIGMPGVIAFSIGSGVSMAVFTGLCIKSCCTPRPETEGERIHREYKEKQEAERQERLETQKRDRERREAAKREAAEMEKRIQEVKHQLEEMTPSELLDCLSSDPYYENAFPAIDSKPNFPAIEDASPEEVARTRIAITEGIKSEINGQLKIHQAAKEAPSIADFMSYFMSSLYPFLLDVDKETDAGKVATFLEIALECTNYKFTPLRLATAFEHLKWPDDDFKMEVLTRVLGNYIALAENYDGNGLFISHGSDVINLSGETPEEYKLPKAYLSTHALRLIAKNIFGPGDYRESLLEVPESLYAALGYAITLLGESSAQNLREKYESGSIDSNTRIGIKLVVGQSMECRFPPSLMTPLLPHLFATPGLVGLELSDIGLVGPWKQVSSLKKKEKPLDDIGFRDEDISALLCVVQSNPYLLDVIINTKSMSTKGEAAFKQEWAEIWTNYKRETPSIEGLLGIDAGNEVAANEDEESGSIKIEEIIE